MDTPPAALCVAIVGAGKMGQHHAHALRRLVDLARLVAVADPTPAARESVQRIWPDATAFSSLEEMLAATEIDVVHVCAAPEMHERLAMLSLGAGCHVYVEKPVVQSAKAAEALMDLAEERRLLVCPGHQLLFESGMREMADLLPSLGPLVHVESFFSFRPVRRPPAGGRAMASDAQFLDVLPHPVYVLLDVLKRAQPNAAEVELAALEVGRAGTVHALLRRGPLTGTLVVTLEGRPIESYLRAVGANGTVHADFVRGTVQRLIGPGSSGIDKALNPYRLSRQILFGTSGALGRRLLKRERSYPGLAEIFEAFYRSIRAGGPSPVSPSSIIDTVRICERVAGVLCQQELHEGYVPATASEPYAIVTGGTGFLGRAIAETFSAGHKPVRVLARRLPAMWERVPEVEYVTADLGNPLQSALFDGASVVIHCAAETAGGWDEHARNSVAATENVLRAAAAAGVSRVIHVSSLATLAAPRNREPLRDDSPLESQPATYGPYVWGKVESERLAARLGSELGLNVRIVRPGALVDYDRFDPPGALGRRIGNIFIAVGKPSNPVGAADVHFAGRTLAWMATHFDSAPPVLNLLAPTLPTRRELVSTLRRSNPDLIVVWLPNVLLRPLSWFATALQKGLRPGKPAVDVAKVFAQKWYDTSGITRIAHAMVTDGAVEEAIAGRETREAVRSS